MDDFGQLIEKEVPSLRRYAHALVRDPDRADDLVQDALERAWRKSHLWVRRTNLRGWLMTILHNLHANAARKFNTSPRMVPLEPINHTAASPPGQTDALNLAVLQETLQNLPAEQREVLVMVGMEQMRYAEVAEALRIPVGTVMSRLFRARERLRIAVTESTKPVLRRVK